MLKEDCRELLGVDYLLVSSRYYWKEEPMACLARMWGFTFVLLSVLIIFPSPKSWSPAEAIRSSPFLTKSVTPWRFKEAPAFENAEHCVSGARVCDPALVHIALTLDAEYLRGSIAAVVSILKHAACPRNVFFHFLVTDSAMELESLVRSTFPFLKFKVYFFNPNRVRGLISSSVRQALEQPLNYARNYLAELLEPCVERVIYLDSDLVVVDDVSKLWNISLRNKTIGAPEYCHAKFSKYFSASFWSDSALSESFGRRRPCYFNTGVMVMDLTRWRLENYTKQLEKWMEIQKEKRIYELGSLPPFLLVFAGNVEAVEHRWNQHGLGGDNVLGSCRDLHPGPVSLLHWSGKGKPWIRLDSKEPCPLDHLWAPYDLYADAAAL